MLEILVVMSFKILLAYPAHAAHAKKASFLVPEKVSTHTQKNAIFKKTQRIYSDLLEIDFRKLFARSDDVSKWNGGGVRGAPKTERRR